MYGVSQMSCYNEIVKMKHWVIKMRNKEIKNHRNKSAKFMTT